MDKKLKEKLNNVSLFRVFDKNWVEKAADEGFKRFYDTLKQSYPENLRHRLDEKVFINHNAVIYYTAFEDSLNTFIMQVMEDSLHEVSLAMDELCKVTATFRKKKD